jgi:ribosomal protein S18 acetylase RimI-like enzyme
VSDQVNVRLARPDDVDRIAALTVSAYIDEGLLSADDPYIAELADAGSRLRDAELWVAEIDGDVVGAVTFCPPGSPYRELGGDGEGEFRMLAVDPHARGRGVARALVRRCLDRSRELGLSEVVICSMPTMQPAHRLYAGLGFSRDESLDWDVDAGLRLWGFRACVPDVASARHD